MAALTRNQQGPERVPETILMKAATHPAVRVERLTHNAVSLHACLAASSCPCGYPSRSRLRSGYRRRVRPVVGRR